LLAHTLTNIAQIYGLEQAGDVRTIEFAAPRWQKRAQPAVVRFDAELWRVPIRKSICQPISTPRAVI
jgi:hypothetical protein